MTAIVIAAIMALGTVLAAAIPAVLAHQAKTSANSASATGGTTLAAVLRLEGKVDELRDDLNDLRDWRAVHEAIHAPPPVQLAPVRRRASARGG